MFTPFGRPCFGAFKIPLPHLKSLKLSALLVKATGGAVGEIYVVSDKCLNAPHPLCSLNSAPALASQGEGWAGREG